MSGSIVRQGIEALFYCKRCHDITDQVSERTGYRCRRCSSYRSASHQMTISGVESSSFRTTRPSHQAVVGQQARARAHTWADSSLGEMPKVIRARAQ